MTAELEGIEQRHEIVRLYRLQEWPDMIDPHNGWTFRPRWARVRVVRGTQSEVWQLDEVFMGGPRVLKGDRLGRQSAVRTYYLARETPPAEVAELARRALAFAECERQDAAFSQAAAQSG